MDVRKILGDNVKAYRVQAALSQEELAGRMGVEQGYISRLEAGSRNPTIVTVAEAANALGVQVAALLEVPLGKPKKSRR